MSLFIAALALRGELLDEAKVGILAGSTASAALGCLLLARFLPGIPPAAPAGPNAGLRMKLDWALGNHLRAARPDPAADVDAVVAVGPVEDYPAGAGVFFAGSALRRC